MKSMILFYSNSGKTEKLAKEIQNALGSDILKVEPEKPYGKGLSAILRMIMERVRGTIPAIRTEVPNLSSYDVVLVGFPVWANDVPALLTHFVKKCNLTGKTLIPFATSGGSGIEKSVNTLKRINPDSKITLEHLYASSTGEGFEQWLQSIRSVLT